MGIRGGLSSRLEIGSLQPCVQPCYNRVYSIVKTVSAKLALTVINTATFRNAILQTEKFPSIDRLVTPTAPLGLLFRPSVLLFGLFRLVFRSLGTIFQTFFDPCQPPYLRSSLLTAGLEPEE